MRERFRGGQQVGGIHFIDEAGAHLIVDMQQGFTVVLGINQFPQDLARAMREGFQHIGDFSRVKVAEQGANLSGSSRVQGA